MKRRPSRDSGPRVKTLGDMSPAEVAALESQYGCRVQPRTPAEQERNRRAGMIARRARYHLRREVERAFQREHEAEQDKGE